MVKFWLFLIATSLFMTQCVTDPYKDEAYLKLLEAQKKQVEAQKKQVEDQKKAEAEKAAAAEKAKQAAIEREKEKSKKAEALMATYSNRIIVKSAAKELADNSYSYYCKDSKQIRPLQFEFTGIIQPPPSGVSLYDANKVREYQEVVLKGKAKYFFGGIDRYGEHTEHPDVQILSYPLSDLEKSCQPSHRQDGCIFSDTSSLLGRKRPIASPKYGFYLPSIVTNEGTIFATYMDSEVLMFSHVGKPLVKGAIPGKLVTDNWAANYVLLIPYDIQKKVFEKAFMDRWMAENVIPVQGDKQFTKKEMDRIKLMVMAMKRVFYYDDKGKLDVKSLTDRKAQEEAWSLYFYAFTNVKQAQTNDPNKIQFQTSLDLTMFCAYARPMSDFFTK